MKQAHTMIVIAAALSAMATASVAGVSSTQKPAVVPQAQQVVNPRAAGATVLLVQDAAPWGSAANETVLGNLGVAYATATTADLAAMSTRALNKYSVIIIASDQPQSAYDTLAIASGKLNKWVKNGVRTLQFHAADNGWAGGHYLGTLPKSVTSVQAYDNTNHVVKAGSPLVAGVPTDFTGSWASHNALVGAKTNKTITTDTLGNVTLVDYCVGTGRVIASGQTLEIGYDYGWDTGKVLVNMTTSSTSAPGCQ